MWHADTTSHTVSGTITEKYYEKGELLLVSEDLHIPH